MTPVTEIDFGTTFVDYFGSGHTPTHNVVVRNLSDTVLRVIVTGDTGDTILPVFGPSTGDLKLGRDNAFILQRAGSTGDSALGWVGLTLINPTTGSKQTTIIFRATDTGDEQVRRVIVAEFTGNGPAITAPFSVNSSPWELEWSVDTSVATFILVNAQTGQDISVIHRTSKGSGAWLVFQTPGTYRLRVETGAGWQVKVIDYPE